MNAGIKINGLSHLYVLEELLFSKINVRDDKIQLVKLPFNNFVNQIISIYSQYCKTLADIPLNIFIVSHYIKKYPTPFETYRHLYGLIMIWKRYIDSHEQSRILLSMLASQRSSRQNVKLFLKIRKAILKNINCRIMQEIKLSHEDIITISHTIFSPQMKSYVSKKINQLFITLKKKTLYSNTILNGAVICEFFMNCAQKFKKQELQNIKAFNQKIEQEQKGNYLKHIKLKTNMPLQYQMQQYSPKFSMKKTNNYNISEVVDCEQKIPQFKINGNQEERQHFYNFQNANISQFNFEDNKKPNDYKCKGNMIDEKYSNSWRKFIQTNQMTKEKLLKPCSQFSQIDNFD